MRDFDLEVCAIISEISFGARSFHLDVVGWILDGNHTKNSLKLPQCCCWMVGFVYGPKALLDITGTSMVNNVFILRGWS